MEQLPQMLQWSGAMSFDEIYHECSGQGKSGVIRLQKRRFPRFEGLSPRLSFSRTPCRLSSFFCRILRFSSFSKRSERSTAGSKLAGMSGRVDWIRRPVRSSARESLLARGEARYLVPIGILLEEVLHAVLHKTIALWVMRRRRAVNESIFTRKLSKWRSSQWAKLRSVIRHDLFRNSVAREENLQNFNHSSSSHPF